MRGWSYHTTGTVIAGYSKLSSATHPEATSLAFGMTGDNYRISTFDPDHARMALGYLLETGYRLLGFLGEEVQASERNPAWLELANEAFHRWIAWHDEEHQRLMEQSELSTGILEDNGLNRPGKSGGSKL